jgi:hypothetical protein
MRDPTRNEMLTFLAGFYPGEADQFDREAAIYWFANDWHGGQWSNLYAALCASMYRPGLTSNGVLPGSMAAMLYEELQARYCEVAEDKEARIARHCEADEPHR